MRIEPHGFDQVSVRYGSGHEIPLDQAFGPFIAANAVRDKPRSEPELRQVGLSANLQRPDQHVERGIARPDRARRLDPSHHPGIGPASFRLELRQRLDRRELRRPGDRSAREDRLQHINRAYPLAQRRRDSRYHLVKRRKALDHEQIGHRDRTGFRHSRQIVAKQIDDHQIFRALFGVALQSRDRDKVGGIVRAPRRRSLHRPGLDRAFADGEELLGRKRQQPAAGMTQYSAPPRRRLRAQSGVDRKGITRHRHVAAKGQIHLIKIAREKMLANLVGGGQIIAALDPRFGFADPASRRIGQPSGRIDGLKPVEQPEP